MDEQLAPLAHLAAAAAVVFMVICRARHMSVDTLLVVKVQTGITAAAALFSLAVPIRWAVVIVVAGYALNLLLSSPRWAHDVPVGARKGRP